MRMRIGNRYTVHGSTAASTFVARVLPRRAFVAVLVVASQSGHELLRVIVLYVGYEVVSCGTTQRRRMATVVTDHHFVADEPVSEAAGRGAMPSSMRQLGRAGRPQHDPRCATIPRSRANRGVSRADQRRVQDDVNRPVDIGARFDAALDGFVASAAHRGRAGAATGDGGLAVEHVECGRVQPWG